MEGWDIHWKKPASTSLVSVSKVYEINLLTYLLTYLLTCGTVSNFMISQNKTEALKLSMTVHWYQRLLVGEQGRG